MSVRLAQCGPVERRIKQRAMDARRRIANAVPKQLAAPAKAPPFRIVLPPTLDEIKAKYRIIQWPLERNFDAHIKAWHRREVEGASLEELRGEFIAICDEPWIEIVSSRRQRSIVHWRQAYMEAAKRHTTHSLVKIGRFVGGKDHTTVLHAANAVQQAVEAGRVKTITSPSGYVFHLRLPEARQ